MEYYVDNSHSDGAGSRDNPWNNIAGHVHSLSAGDTMFVRGDSPGTRTYSEAQILIAVSGSSDKPITIRPYAGESVCLKSTATGSDQIRINGSYVTITGFEIDRGGAAKRIIYIRGNHNTIDDCEIHNGGQKAVVVHRASHTTVSGCVIHDIVRDLVGAAAGVAIYGTLTGTTITGCTMYNINGDHVVVDDTEGSVATGTIVEGCLFYNGSLPADTVENAVDIKDGSVIVRNCRMHGFREEGSAAGSAMMFHNKCTTVLIEDCEIYDSTTGIRVSGPTATIRRCVVWDLASVDPKAWVKTALLIQGGTVQVFNCTFYKCPEHLAYVSPGTVAFQNNICKDTGSVTGSAAASHNCWHNAKGKWSGTGDILTDPMFRNQAAGDFRLTDTSPCRGAGSDGQDIGAFSYEAAPPPPPPEETEIVAWHVLLHGLDEDGKVVKAFSGTLEELEH